MFTMRINRETSRRMSGNELPSTTLVRANVYTFAAPTVGMGDLAAVAKSSPLFLETMQATGTSFYSEDAWLGLLAEPQPWDLYSPTVDDLICQIINSLFPRTETSAESEEQLRRWYALYWYSDPEPEEQRPETDWHPQS